MIGSYNVHRCIGTDRRSDPDRIAAVLRELDADIIGLQEVDSAFRIGGGIDQVEYLSAATGLTGIAGPTLRNAQGHYGNALLTHSPVVAVRHLDLSVNGREPRGALDVDLDAGGHRMQVIVTHFGLRGTERRRQARRLLESVSPETDHPIFLMGDFNEWRPRGGILRILQPHFGWSPFLRTFPSMRPIFALDRIWIRPAGALISVGVHRSPLARVASDHLPLRAVIRL